MPRPNPLYTLDAMDDTLLKMHENLGRYWQNLTGKDKDTLARYTMMGSGASWLFSAGMSAFSQNYLLVPFYTLAGLSSASYGLRKPKKFGDLATEVEEVEHRTLSDLFRRAYPVGYIMSTYFTFISGSFTIGSLILDNTDLFVHSLTRLSAGAAFTLYLTSEYLGRIRIEPPKKRRKRNLKEWVKGKLPQLKNPFRQPIPVNGMVEYLYSE